MRGRGLAPSVEPEGRRLGHFRIWAAGFLISSFIFCLATPASDVSPAVEEAAKPPLDDLSLQELLGVEFGTVYSASRREQRLWEAPASVSIVRRDEIQAFGYRSLAEVLRSVPGIYTGNDRNYTYLGIRGFSRPGDYNSRVLVLVDGHRVNDNVYDGTLLGQDALVEVDSIERVEVVRGPSSSLYGSSAFFGVVNVVTRRGADVDGVEFSGEGGSFDTYKGRVTIGRKFKSGVEFFLSGSYYESEGQDRLYFREFDHPDTNRGIARGLDGEEAWHSLAKLSYRDFTLAAGFNKRTKSVPTASYGTVFNDRGFETLDRASYVDLSYEKEFENELRLTVRLGLHHYRYLGAYPFDLAEAGDPPLIINNADAAHGDWWGAETLLTKPLFERLVLTGGGEFRSNFHHDQKNFNETVPREVFVDDHFSSSVFGLFGQADLAVFTNLIASAGLRYDHYSTVGDSLNPRLGLMYQPRRTTTLKLLYGQAFRAPNAYEWRYSAPGFVRSPGLKPETIDTWEIVAEEQVREWLKLGVSGFYYEVDGLISLKDDGGELGFQNLDSARALGTEWMAESRWAGDWLARVSYTAQRAEDAETCSELTNTPRHIAKFHLRIPLISDRLFSGAELQYVGSVKAVRSGRVNDFLVANWTLFSREWIKGIELSATVYNLFDQRYGITGYDEHAQRVLMQDGRAFRLKMTYRF